MLNIAVLDDEEIYIDRICNITKNCMSQMETEYEICLYKNGEDVLADLRKGKYFDIYLLDMKLPDMDGLEVAKHIRRRFSKPILIYITHYVNYSIEAYEVNAYRYILKTKLEEKLPQAYLAIGKTLEKRKEGDRFCIIERYGKQEKIFCKDIYYLKKDKKYVVIVHKDGETPVRISLGAMVEKLQGEEFLMIDRSYVVNMDYVESINKDGLCIGNGETLPVSRPKWNYVWNAIMKGGR